MPVWLRKLRYRLRPVRSARRPRRPRRGGGPRRLLPALALALVLTGAGAGFCRMEARVGALAQQAALSQLNGRITKEINQAVLDTLEETGTDTRALLDTRQDEAGQIRSLSADLNQVNTLKALLTVKVQESLDTLDVIEARIPVGMLFSDSLFTGAGFSIPVRVFATNAIEVRLLDDFTQAGVNQTRYRLWAEVTVPARIVGVLRQADTQVQVEVPVAETVVMGSVPNAYAQLGPGAISSPLPGD